MQCKGQHNSRVLGQLNDHLGDQFGAQKSYYKDSHVLFGFCYCYASQCRSFQDLPSFVIEKTLTGRISY